MIRKRGNHINTSAADLTIGARLRFARTNAGLSQYTLGGKLGVSLHQIQKYEQGTNRIAAATLNEICLILKVDPNTLLGWKETKTSPTERLMLSSSDSIRLAVALDEVLPRHRRAILRLALTLKKRARK